MKREYRLLLTGHDSAFMNMAIDEAVLHHQGKVPPTIRFYGWKPAAVSIGYFQSLVEEVDLSRCEGDGIDFIRRITGGGAVFHDRELTYSLITPESDPLIPKDILASYKAICSGIIAGLKDVGVSAEFVPLNDIIAGGKKISGNAQTRRSHCVLQHGTILMDVDVKRMFSLLRVPAEKMRDKLIKAVEERVTSVSAVIGRTVSFGELEKAMIAGFEKELGIKLTMGKLTESEQRMAKRLAEEKYMSRDWRFKR